jgi:hypothetical protein
VRFVITDACVVVVEVVVVDGLDWISGRKLEQRWKEVRTVLEGRWKSTGREVEPCWKEGGRVQEGRWNRVGRKVEQCGKGF